MIKGRIEFVRREGSNKGERVPLLLLGLSKVNMEKLMNDEPIHIGLEDLEGLALPTDMEILIVGGETEASIAAELAKVVDVMIEPTVAEQIKNQVGRIYDVSKGSRDE